VTALDCEACEESKDAKETSTINVDIKSWGLNGRETGREWGTKYTGVIGAWEWNSRRRFVEKLERKERERRDGVVVDDGSDSDGEEQAEDGRGWEYGKFFAERDGVGMGELEGLMNDAGEGMDVRGERTEKGSKKGVGENEGWVDAAFWETVEEVSGVKGCGAMIR
jgi:hypothetical protein